MNLRALFPALFSAAVMLAGMSADVGRIEHALVGFLSLAWAFLAGVLSVREVE